MVHGEERLQLSEDRYVKINFASSGQQESIWILYVLFYYLLNNKKAYFIIEEPESHLFPNAQKLITEFISLVKNNGSRVLMTTHSPYILGTINNLLYANKISEKVDASALEKVVSHLKRIDFKDMSAHYVEHGEVQSCMDEELESIENEIIDGASDDINAEFEKMLEFVYGTEED